MAESSPTEKPSAATLLLESLTNSAKKRKEPTPTNSNKLPVAPSVEAYSSENEKIHHVLNCLQTILKKIEETKGMTKSEKDGLCSVAYSMAMLLNSLAADVVKLKKKGLVSIERTVREVVKQAMLEFTNTFLKTDFAEEKKIDPSVKMFTLPKVAKKGESVMVKTNDPVKFMEFCKTEINPVKINSRISNLKKKNDNTVVIQSPTPHELENYTKELKRIFPNITIVKPVLKNPHIVIFGEFGLTEEDLVRALTNMCGEPPLGIKAIGRQSGRNKTLVQLSTAALKKIESEDPETLILGYRRCRYERYVPVTRCFKCHRYGHRDTACQITDEELKDVIHVVRKSKCSNCYLYAKGTIKKPEDELLDKELKEEILSCINHTVFDPNCPILLFLKSKVAQQYKFE